VVESGILRSRPTMHIETARAHCCSLRPQSRRSRRFPGCRAAPPRSPSALRNVERAQPRGIEHDLVLLHILRTLATSERCHRFQLILEEPVLQRCAMRRSVRRCGRPAHFPYTRRSRVARGRARSRCGGKRDCTWFSFRAPATRPRDRAVLERMYTNESPKKE